MKTKLSRILMWIGITLFLLLASFLTLQRFEFFDNAMLNMSFRYDDEKIYAKLQDLSPQPEIKYTALNEYNIRYLQLMTGADLPYVIFIHGAPGSLADYLAFFRDEKLTSKANLISVDRLGYGYSEYGAFMTSLEMQATAIEKVIEEACANNEALIVGHSYGGPIALQLASTTKRKYLGLLLLAPAIDPEHEKKVSFARLGFHRWTRWLATPALQVASAEKLSHVSELQKLQPRLSSIHIPVCHIHGTADSLVPYANVAFARKVFSPGQLEIITLDKVDHFLPWSHHGLVVDQILSMLERSHPV